MEVRRCWTKENLRDSLIALYQGRVWPNDIPKKSNQVSRQRSLEPKFLLPKFLPASTSPTRTGHSQERLAELFGCSAFSRRLHTGAKMRSALKAIYGKELTEKKAGKQQQEKAAFEDVIGRVTRNELEVTETGLQGLSVQTMRDCEKWGRQHPPRPRKQSSSRRFFLGFC